MWCFNYPGMARTATQAVLPVHDMFQCSPIVVPAQESLLTMPRKTSLILLNFQLLITIIRDWFGFMCFFVSDLSQARCSVHQQRVEPGASLARCSVHQQRVEPGASLARCSVHQQRVEPGAVPGPSLLRASQQVCHFSFIIIWHHSNF